MANVQRGVNQPADTQEYQILDFQETLQKCIEGICIFSIMY